MSMVDTEHAFDAPDDSADRGADHGADRTGDPVAFMESMRGTAGNTLGLRGQRNRNQCEEYAREYGRSFHCFSLFVWSARRLAVNHGGSVTTWRWHQGQTRSLPYGNIDGVIARDVQKEKA
jgi:hypothetical protein